MSVLGKLITKPVTIINGRIQYQCRRITMLSPRLYRFNPYTVVDEYMFPINQHNGDLKGKKSITRRSRRYF